MSTAIQYFRDAAESGVLPVEGGLLDQAAAFVRGFRIFQHSRGKAQEHTMEKQKKESESKLPKTPTAPGFKKPSMPSTPRFRK